MTDRKTASNMVAKLENITTLSSGNKDELVAMASEVSTWAVGRSQMGRNPAEFSTAVDNYVRKTDRANWQRVQAAARRLLPSFRELGNTHL